MWLSKWAKSSDIEPGEGGKEMATISAKISAHHKAYLEKLSDNLQISMSAVVRQAIEEFVKRSTK